MLDKFVYNIANTKSYGHVMININDWISTNNLLCINLKGKVLPSKITKAVKINSAPAYRPLPFKEGAVIALSAIATRIGLLRPFNIPNDPNGYANVHISQILGYFKNEVLSLDNFQLIYDKVLLEKIDIPPSNYLNINDDNISVCKVLAIGDGGFNEKWERIPMNANVGDYVLLRDNITTSITLEGKEYYVTDDKYIVGRFQGLEFDFNSLIPFKNVNIFEAYESDTIEGSFLLKPYYKEDIEISETYQDNLFKLIKSDSLSKGIYIIDRFKTEYIKFKNRTYFIAQTKDIIGIKKEN